MEPSALSTHPQKSLLSVLFRVVGGISLPTLLGLGEVWGKGMGGGRVWGRCGGRGWEGEEGWGRGCKTFSVYWNPDRLAENKVFHEMRF